MHITLCILTRNERPCVEIVFPQLPKPGPESGFDAIVVIDGGSTDGTKEYFEERGIPVLGQSRRGRGHAFQIAFDEVDSDAYIFFSPDGNEDPKDLPKFRPLLEQGFDLVIASRMMAGAKNEEDDQFLKLRKWANNAFNIGANLCFRRKGTFVTDSINGYRAITREAARTLALDAPDYTIEYQMTMRAFKHKLSIAEFPTIEYPRVAGDTQAQSIPTGVRFIKAFWHELRGA
ncbi:glycosyltransferase family 2 protein [Microvirga sp. 3-52]|uniref:glycosyltransferase family 2 protein n=1 Tax=Microvirga sp. 3-52 TaxID=2792425 RepID=UPI001ACF880B|nr:glycosyltransferase family 2 protein [Microvirga sp. 3-52]MBO1905776.1 glycosyltransferase family 2 protein [Microvirga sp. 3-52]MBS7453127.1 glycosyltransferase family 2 protein [Microvirga sp. 3-52]